MSDAELKQYMSMALEEARKAAELGEVPVGAVFVIGAEVLVRGRNIREASGKTTGHAEINALEIYNQSSGQWILPKGTSVFVTCEPCLMCTGALIWARAESIYYGCTDTKNAGINRLQTWLDEGVYDHRFVKVQSGILENECATLMSDFFRQRRKTKN